jgi:arsenate reductase (glutaredoxin)
MSRWTLYHNPRCSKSRAALVLLEKHGIAPQVIDYLKTPPSAAELRSIVRMLGIPPEQLIRRGEDVFKTQYAGKQLSDDQWIEAMAANPILIERPIVIRDQRAVLGRPAENVAKLIG